MRLILIVLSAAILMPSLGYSGDLPKWMTGDHGMRIVTEQTPEQKAKSEEMQQARLKAHREQLAKEKAARPKAGSTYSPRSAIIFNGDGTTSLIIY